MRCPKCGADKTGVRVTNDLGDSVERIRQCKTCRAWFRTLEEAEYASPSARCLHCYIPAAESGLLLRKM